MIPLADDNPTKTRPYIVYILVAVNIAVYITDRLGAMGPFGHLYNWSLIPRYLIFGDQVTQNIPVIVDNAMKTMQIKYTGLEPRWLTVFSSMFMHGSVMHIAGNMLYLWIFGNNIEDTLGHFKFLAFYLACGVAAALAQVFVNVNSPIPMVGASGAIAGVLGAYLILFPGHSVHTLVLFGFFWTTVEIPALILLGFWFILQLTGLWGTGGSLGGGVAYWAHIGGFIAGLVLIMILGGRRLTQGRPRRQSRYQPDRPYPW